MNSNSGSHGGFLGERHVAFWTVLGGMAAVLGIIITVFLLTEGGGSSGATSVTPPPIGGHSSMQAQSPSVAVSPMKSSPQASVRPPVLTYLSDLTPVGGTRTGGGSDVTISGVDYPHSVVILCLGSDVTGQQDNNIEYNTGLKGRQFTGLVGIGDTEDASGIAADVSFYGDGNLLKTAKVTLGHPDLVHFSLKGVLRLQIVVFIVQSPYDGRSINVSVANANFTATG